MRLVYDIEANGLLDTVTTIHCIVCIDLDTAAHYYFYEGEWGLLKSGDINAGLFLLSQADEIIAHNQKCYDILALLKVEKWRVSPHTKVTDTLVMSKALNPDRSPVKGCKSGPHSLEAWGIRLGRHKPHHEEWEVFSPEMLHRCIEDVEINLLTYHSLKKEEDGIDYTEVYEVEGRVAVEAVIAEFHGWPFNRLLALNHMAHLSGLMEEIEHNILPKIPLIPKCQEGNATEDWVTKNVVEWAASLGWQPHIIQLFAQVSKKKWVASVRTKAGHPTAQVVKHCEGSTTSVNDVWGPFSRLEWEVINLGSDGQVKDYLLSLGWRPTEWNISKKTGMVTSPKLTEDSLDDMESDVGNQIAQWLKCRHRRSQLEGWVEACREDGRVPSVMNTLACPTVRMSHKIIANVPSVEKGAYFAKEMRECFIAEPGYVIVGCDAASCQLRLLTHYMDDDAYREAVLFGDKDAGTDVHSVNMRAAGLPTRGHAKNFIYGFLFGAGATKVGRLIKGDAKAGQAITNKFLKQLPALDQLRKQLLATWKERGCLIAIDGRRLFVRKQHELLCYLLQGAEAILMKKATIILLDWIRQEGLDARLLNIYHDEYSLMVKEEQAQRVAFLAEEAIRVAGEFYHLNTPMAGGAAIGYSWADVH